VIQALNTALITRKPQWVIHHSDQGSQGEPDPSSQHVQTVSVNEAEDFEIESMIATEAVVARQVTGTALRRAKAVLEGDRGRTYQRGRSRSCRRGTGCRNSMVPTKPRPRHQPSPDCLPASDLRTQPVRVRGIRVNLCRSVCSVAGSLLGQVQMRMDSPARQRQTRRRHRKLGPYSATNLAGTRSWCALLGHRQRRRAQSRASPAQHGRTG
jgi:hypothetical protein